MSNVPTSSTIQNNAGNSKMPEDDFRYEEQRLKTFGSDWPHSFIDPQRLAKSGCYFIGPFDQVRCHFCKVEMGQWSKGQCEVRWHGRMSPHCYLLTLRDKTNVPLEPRSEMDELLKKAYVKTIGWELIDKLNAKCQGEDFPT